MKFILKWIKTFGSYLLLMKRAIGRPESWKMFGRQFMRDIYQLGVNSIPIVLIISPPSMGLPGRNAGVGSQVLLQGIFLTQGPNPHLLHLLHW